MGQIVIDIPNRKTRRYVFTDAKLAEELLSALEASAVRVKNNPAKLTREELEDIEDLRDAKKLWKNTGEPASAIHGKMLRLNLAYEPI